MTTQEVLQIFKIHKEDFLMGLESDDSPVAFVLGGQPASGKTALAECCMNIYPAKRFLRINGDLYRQYCPGHNEIISNGIEHYSERTQIFSNVFTQELIKEAINRHLNVIVEGTMRNPDVPSGTVKMFHDAGFTTEVSIVAAPKEFSCINAMHRYQEQVEFEGFGRLPDMRSHDAAVEGVLKSADRLYEEKVADRIHIFSFNPVSLIKTFSPSDAPGEKPSEVIIQERVRQMEDGERIEKIYRKGTRLKETLDPRFHHFIEEPMRRLEEARLKVSMRLFRPYYEEESALLWIGRHLELHPVDRKLLYHLNIISNIIHNGTGRSEIFPLYRRLPQEALGGLPKGGRRNAQASLLLRGGFAAGGKKPDGLGTSGYTAEQELLGSWAERDGCWKDFADGFLQKNGARFLSSGSEARVYLKNGYVYKTIDWNHYGTMAKVLDRISIHNAFFPETKMEVLGFGMRDDAEDNRGFCVIVKQPFVVGEIPSGPEEVHTAMKESGIDLPSFASAWCFLDKKENILLYDLHDQNIVVDKYGNVQVFDCEAFINTDPKLHGTFEIPDVKGSEAAVRRIDTILDSLLPVPMSRRWFLDTFSSPESGLAEQLDACGHIDGTVRTPTGQEYLVEADPEDPGNVLISTPTQVAAMLRGCPDIPGDKYIAVLSDLVHGKTVDTPSGPVRFSLDRGRLEKCPSQRTLKKTCRSERKINPVIESTKGMHL